MTNRRELLRAFLGATVVFSAAKALPETQFVGEETLLPTGDPTREVSLTMTSGWSLRPGDVILISGSQRPAYDGHWRITSANGSQIRARQALWQS